MATVASIIDEVREIIHDTNASTYRWADDELIDYVNASTRQIVQLVPEANAVSEAVNITDEIARQTLPSGGIALIKVARNASTDGTTFEGTIRRVEKDALDTYDPDWEYNSAKADAANYFQHWAHDPAEPKTYYLYPTPPNDTRYIELVYSKIPTAMAAPSDIYPLADEYINATVMYVVYRALTKEARDTLPDAFRQDLYNNFLQALGLQKEARRNAPPTKAPEGE